LRIHSKRRVFWRTERFSDDPAHHPGIATKGKTELTRGFETIENRMFGQESVVGQDYSVLDPYLLVFFRWGSRIGFDMRAQYPRWTKHALRMLARPAVQRALATEGISLWG
jgi:glutathione S-transferase